jgi:hypothetical protein
MQAIDQAPEDAQQRAVYLCNAAACYLKKEMWQLAVEQSTAALTINDAYLKVRPVLAWCCGAAATPLLRPAASRLHSCCLVMQRRVTSLLHPAACRAAEFCVPCGIWRWRLSHGCVSHCGLLCAQALMRRSQALQQLDDLERALADAQRVRTASGDLSDPASDLQCGHPTCLSLIKCLLPLC